MSVEFIGEPFAVAIKEGFVLLIYPDGTKRSVPLRVFRIMLDRASRALAEYDGRNAEVVPIKPRKK